VFKGSGLDLGFSSSRLLCLVAMSLYSLSGAGPRRDSLWTVSWCDYIVFRLYKLVRKNELTSQSS
jgi:hypothetical protein